jgi:hypothetical protein
VRAVNRLRWAAASAAETVAPRSLAARREAVRLNFVVHTERIAHEATWRALVHWSRAFRSVTGERLVCCVTTPLCPQTAYQLGQEGTTETQYASRVAALAEDAVIGYHGHFFHRRPGVGGERNSLWGDDLVPMTAQDQDIIAVRAQVVAEMNWLRGLGVAADIYAAGWWVLTNPLLDTLADAGITIDTSVRGVRPDKFGHRVLRLAPPPGAAVRLPPAGRIVGLQSLFGPIGHPWRTLGHLRRLVAAQPDRPSYGVLHLHDYDLPEWRTPVEINVRRLTRHSQFRWANVHAMAAEARTRGSLVDAD